MGTRLDTLAAVAAMCMMVGAVQAAGVPGQGTWETTLLGRDLDGDNIADAFYDTDLDITWLSDANANGLMGYGTAVDWVRYFNIAGFYKWRLPTMDGEMAHLWFDTLGNPAGGPMTNTGSFQNMQSGSYWLGPVTTVSTKYAFSTIDGIQSGYRRGLFLINFHAMAVRPGDIGVVPEPEVGAMMLMGLGVLAIGLRRRR